MNTRIYVGMWRRFLGSSGVSGRDNASGLGVGELTLLSLGFVGHPLPAAGLD